MKEDIDIVYRLAKTENDRILAISFIKEWFWQHHQWVTPPSAGELVIACQKDEIVGAVNLDFRDGEACFPLEELYGPLNVASGFPFFDRRIFVQGGRWSAAKPTVSRGLLRTIAEHCTPLGIRYMLVEAKQYSIERLEQLGIRFLVLYGVYPNFQSVPLERRKYYTDPPIPRLVVIQIENLF